MYYLKFKFTGTTELCFKKNLRSYVFKGFFILEKSSHSGEASHLSEILAEWCISFSNNKSFI